ncbi:Hcn4 [Symbiodinium natans]|uniref:Hcn4 protein n=1 Tax=Symbiodinium natans TaxID=878477 RepID=A0A812HVF6_9DINO|nr:Hcn4 [Symbiodinium natans]
MANLPALLHSLRELEDQLQKVLGEVRAEVDSLSTHAEPQKAEKTSQDPSSEVPLVLKSCVMCEETERENASHVGIRSAATQHAASLLGHTESHPKMHLNSHFMELSLTSGGALHAAGSAGIQPAALRANSGFSPQRMKERTMLNSFWSAVLAPHSRPRIAWDAIGTGLVILDALILPLSLAWDFDVSPMKTDEVFLQFYAVLHLVFWPLDILVNFNTGFYQKGVLNLKRSSIAKNYMQTWLSFDLAIVAIDWLSVIIIATQGDSGVGYARSLRTARYLRALRSFRVLRIVKDDRVNAMLENIVIAMGRQWLILAFNVMKMLAWIGCTAHLLACAWWGVGMLHVATGNSWIDYAGVTQSSGYVQYIHALAWILQPPSPPELSVLAPNSFAERLVSILLVVVTVLVIGSSLSLLTGTLQEIRTISNERSRKRRELRTYLHAQAAPTELIMRIMSFADYKLERHSPVSFDPDLISPLLAAELAMFQKGHLMMDHPLFSLIRSAFPKVFADICCALEKQLFYEGESVFVVGLLAKGMYITSHGSFCVRAASGSEEGTERFTGDYHFFAEAALFADAVVHDCTLDIETFAEVFFVSGRSMASILMNSPVCAALCVEYAREFVSAYSEGMRSGTSAASCGWRRELRCAQVAMKTNSFYVELHLDERKMLKFVNLLPPTNSVTASVSSRVSSVSSVATAEAPKPMTISQFTSWATVERADPEGFVTKLREVYVELDPAHGLHAMYSEPVERDKAECGCLCLAALASNSYDLFVAPQSAESRLEVSQWNQLRGFLDWAAPTQEMLQAAFFLLSVRSIGKYRTVTRQLPEEHQRPEAALLYILDHFPNVVPSVRSLSETAKRMVTNVLQLQQDFILPQMLQGENVPANLAQLQRFVQETGEETLKFYVVFLLGFMSALQGGKGSSFMTAANAKSIILGLSAVQQLLFKDSRLLYWMYIYQRGLQLHQPAGSAEDLAVLRLACLCRVRDRRDFEELSRDWAELGAPDQEVLTQHFLASGIQNSAIVFEFLPLCLERAKRNPHVSVPCLLEILVVLVKSVFTMRASEQAGEIGEIITVDLSNLAAFILMVQNRFVFQTCLSRSKLIVTQNTAQKNGQGVRDAWFRLDLTEDNWNRVNERQHDVALLASTVRDILHRQSSTKRTVFDTVSV